MIKKLLLSLLVGATALAANPDPSNQFKFGSGTAGDKVIKFNRNQGGANPVIQWTESANTLQFSNDGTNFSDIGSGSGSGGAGINILTNPGFESGIAQGWSNTGGAFLAVNAGSNLLIGKGSATFQAGVSGNFLASTLVTVPNGIAGQSCAASMLYKGGDANLTFEVVDGSSNVLASVVLAATSTPMTLPLTFICPSSGSLRLKLISTAASALVAIDQMSLGNNALINISQAKFVGSVDYAGILNCTWSVSVGGVYAGTSFPADTDCNTAVATGSLLPPSTKIPGFRAALQPGHYLIYVTGGYWNANANTWISGKITNGVDESTDRPTMFTSAAPVASAQGTTVFNMDVTDGSLRTYELQAIGLSAGASTASIDVEGNAGSTLGDHFVMSVYKFPSASEVALRPDLVANSWSGFHSANCGWNTASLTYVDPGFDASCTFGTTTNTNFGTVVSADDGTPGNYIPGIVFTPSRPGKYYVCANFAAETGAGSSNFRLVDGSLNVISTSSIYGTGSNSLSQQPMCGFYQVTNTAPVTLKIQISTDVTGYVNPADPLMGHTIEWSLMQIDYPLPAPLLVGGVVTPSTGVDNIVRVRYGDYATPCTSGTCVLSRSNGGVASVVHTSGGNYTVTFNAGAFSAPPVCSVWVQSPGVVMLVPYTVSEETSTSMSFSTYNSSSALADSSGQILCVGPK